MDEYFKLNGITFVWNREKARRNLVKHGVAFEQAAEAFSDPFVRVIDAGPEEEARDAVIGMDKRRKIRSESYLLVRIVHEITSSHRLKTPSPTLPLPKGEGVQVSPLGRGRFRGGYSRGTAVSFR